MRIVELNETTKKDILTNLLKRSPDNYGEYETIVKEIVEDVHINKDAALFKYTEKFDKATITADNIRIEVDTADKTIVNDTKVLQGKVIVSGDYNCWAIGKYDIKVAVEPQ